MKSNSEGEAGKKRQWANITYAYVFERDTQRAGEGCNGLAVSVATTIYRIEKKFHEKSFLVNFSTFPSFTLYFLFFFFSYFPAKANNLKLKISQIDQHTCM